MSGKRAKAKLYDTHVRLFPDDVAQLKRIAAEKRSEWQVELRQLVHRALRGEARSVTVLKETT